MLQARDLMDFPRIFNGIVDIGPMEFTMRTMPRVFLSGPFDAAGGGMITNLSGAGLLPAEAPYAGSSLLGSSVPANAVDWVLLGLLETNDLSVIAARSAFLMSDGSVAGADGSSGLRLEVSPGYYYLAAKHRNHVTVMSSQPLAYTNRLVMYDFTTGPGKHAGGTNSCVQIGTGIWGMLPGDADGDGFVTRVDLAIVSNSLGRTGYLQADVNLDGTVTKEDVP